MSEFNFEVLRLLFLSIAISPPNWNLSIDRTLLASKRSMVYRSV